MCDFHKIVFINRVEQFGFILREAAETLIKRPGNKMKLLPRQTKSHLHSPDGCQIYIDLMDGWISIANNNLICCEYIRGQLDLPTLMEVKEI